MCFFIVNVSFFVGVVKTVKQSIAFLNYKGGVNSAETHRNQNYGDASESAIEKFQILVVLFELKRVKETPCVKKQSKRSKKLRKRYKRCQCPVSQLVNVCVQQMLACDVLVSHFNLEAQLTNPYEGRIELRCEQRQ